MRVLQWHVALSLIDVSMVILMPFICMPWGNLVVYGGHLVYCFWVPYLVIKNSFNQLDGLCSYIMKKLKGSLS